MTVGADDDQVGLSLLGKTDELVSGRSCRRDGLGSCMHLVAVEESLRITQRGSVAADLDHVHLLSAFQERQSVGERSPCLEGVLPADHDIANVQLAAILRHDQNRAAGAHQEVAEGDRSESVQAGSRGGSSDEDQVCCNGGTRNCERGKFKLRSPFDLETRSFRRIAEARLGRLEFGLDLIALGLDENQDRRLRLTRLTSREEGRPQHQSVRHCADAPS